MITFHHATVGAMTSFSVVGSIDDQGSITIERQVSVTAQSLLRGLEQSLHVHPPEQEVRTLTTDKVDVFRVLLVPQQYRATFTRLIAAG